jgi:hypothetical protein
MNDLLRDDLRNVEVRVAYLAEHHEIIVNLLTEGFDALARSNTDSWLLLRFATVRGAVDWTLETWRSAQFDPAGAGYAWDALSTELWVFAELTFWQVLRLHELQTRDVRSLPRATGASRKEVLSSSIVERAAGEGTVALDGARAEAASIRAMQQFQERLLEILRELGRRTHRAQEILWFRSQQRLRKAIVSTIGDAWSVSEDLPEWLARHPAPTLTKECALAAFRFFVLFEELEPRDDAVGSRAFVFTYLSNFEKPTWVPRPRDRWDIVPKRVVATQLAEIGIQAGSWDVARAARAEMGHVLERGMTKIADLASPLPEEFDSAVQLGLRLLLAEDSVTRTLCDEYARKMGRASAGPSANAIDGWQAELSHARIALAGGFAR